ncbi:MAG: hypothetical protein WA172_01720 [Terriglobales bacterium]
MIIVVVGEIGSGIDGVGRLLAESLGWEFTDVESLDCAAQAGNPVTSAERASLLEKLSAAIDSSTCQWRDLIVSCPALTDKDQRQLRHNHPSVKFVYLKAPNRTDDSFPSDRAVDFVDSEVPVRRCVVENDSSVLSVDSSQGVEQILGAVLSALILKQRSVDVRTA